MSSVALEELSKFKLKLQIYKRMPALQTDYKLEKRCFQVALWKVEEFDPWGELKVRIS